jgi:hypothetical protein
MVRRKGKMVPDLGNPVNPYADGGIEGQSIVAVVPRLEHGGGQRTAEQMVFVKTEILKRRLQRQPFRQIADEMGLDVSRVHQWYTEVMREVPEALASVHRQEQLDILDRMTTKALEVLDGVHFAHSNGRVVVWYDNPEDKQGKPLTDPAPVLAAIQTIVRIEERKAKLLGLDSPIKVTGSLEVTAADIELAGLIQAQNRMNAEEQRQLSGKATD